MGEIEAVDGMTTEWPTVHSMPPNFERVKDWPEDWWYWSNLAGDLRDPHTGKDIRLTYEEDMPPELRRVLETADAADCYLCEKGLGNYKLLLEAFFDSDNEELVAEHGGWLMTMADASVAARRLAAAHPELDVVFEHYRQQVAINPMDFVRIHVFMPWDTPKEKAREIAEEVEREAFAHAATEDEKRGRGSSPRR